MVFRTGRKRKQVHTLREGVRMTTVETEIGGLSRRNFLKLGAAAGGAIGVASLLGAGGTAEKAQAKTYNTTDEMLEIDPEKFKRFDGKNVAFMRACLVPKGMIPPDDRDNQDLFDQWTGANPDTPFTYGDPGYTQIDYAFEYGGQATYNLMGASVTGAGRSFDSCVHITTPSGELAPLTMYGQTSASFPNGGKGGFGVAKDKYQFESPARASYALKKAAKVFGADLVGIAPYDERFVYATEVAMPTDMEGNLIKERVNLSRPMDFGFEPKSVIVLAFEMDYECFKASGSMIETGATYTAYSRMAEVGLRVAQFLRKMGYNTYHCGNNASPSVAEAIRAGLGEGSRMSILMTEEYGPRVRLAKVYTDAVFEYDKPKSFGVTEFCEVCQVCADSCPSQAITHLSINDPENKPTSLCAQDGIKKYHLDAQKCLINWYLPLDGNDCGICIGVCPYNKPQIWHHDVLRGMTSIPGFGSIARFFDGFFGYGGIPDEQTLTDFWRKDI